MPRPLSEVHGGRRGVHWLEGRVEEVEGVLEAGRKA